MNEPVTKNIDVFCLSTELKYKGEFNKMLNEQKI